MALAQPSPQWWLASDGRWYPPELHPEKRDGAQTPTEPLSDVSGWQYKSLRYGGICRACSELVPTGAYGWHNPNEPTRRRVLCLRCAELQGLHRMDLHRTSATTSENKAGFTCAGVVRHYALNVFPHATTSGRPRHKYGQGPFAKLLMPPVPGEPGVYLWTVDDEVVYVGETRRSLRNRLGPSGYSTISTANTLVPDPHQPGSGKTTNCRVNALANEALVAGKEVTIWYRVWEAERAASEEARWMETFGVPAWNIHVERIHIDDRSSSVEYDLHNWTTDATADLMRSLMREGVPYCWESRGTLLTVDSRFERRVNKLVFSDES